LSTPADNTVPSTGVARNRDASFDAGELRRSGVAAPLVALYARIRGPGTSMIRRLICRLLVALEGGQMRSSSLRRVMADVHGIEVGAHSLHPYFYRPVLGASTGTDVDTAPLEIASGSWLGANAIVLPGCRRIGRGAVVGAGAVLTRDVPDYAVVGGNPARLIRYRFDPQAIAAADATRWWLRSPEELAGRDNMSQSWGVDRNTTSRGSGCG
jgi:acetyltransferase-like isoleucine patch superfamily enzyme